VQKLAQVKLRKLNKKSLLAKKSVAFNVKEGFSTSEINTNK